MKRQKRKLDGLRHTKRATSSLAVSSVLKAIEYIAFRVVNKACRIILEFTMSSYRPYRLLTQCPRCLKHKSTPIRRYISTVIANPLIPPDAAYARLPTRRLISLHGQDAHRFLQGLVASNIPPPPNLNGHYSVFLNAAGRVLYDVFIYPATHSKEYRDTVLQGTDEPGLLIEVDADQVEKLASHLKKFKLRAKVQIKVMEDEEWGVWAAWPMESERPDGRYDIHCMDDRAPDMGYRLIRPRKQPPEGDNEVTSEQYDLRRIMMGVAEGQKEIVRDSALPQESNIDYMGGIDFRKGCYVGQELTIRTHHRGVVRKRILPVRIYDSTEETRALDELDYDPSAKLTLPPRGANISRVRDTDDKKGRSTGRWLGGVGTVGLALCRLDNMTYEGPLMDRYLWNSDHQFKVAWEPEEGRAGGEVKVKAFVPEWHRERAEAQNLPRNGQR